MKYLIHRKKHTWWTVEAFPSGVCKLTYGDVFQGISQTYWESPAEASTTIARRLILGYEFVDEVTFKKFLGLPPFDKVS